MQVVNRDQALRSMDGALKPGGWLLVEEGDTITWLPDPRIERASLFSKGTTAFSSVQTAAGVHESYGRRLSVTFVPRFGWRGTAAHPRRSMRSVPTITSSMTQPRRRGGWIATAQSERSPCIRRHLPIFSSRFRIPS
jgi:hypothetical protein